MEKIPIPNCIGRCVKRMKRPEMMRFFHLYISYFIALVVLDNHPFVVLIGQGSKKYTAAFSMKRTRKMLMQYIEGY